ncbi:hypothetical protein BY458DRAFT_441379 [Sporodiniella umbellata]|nr:hypothetical protein BY458DRAFT_441379 [Sporodiniella umbellata]
MSYLCNICNLSFENSKSLTNHKYNAHSDLVTVTLDDGLMESLLVPSAPRNLLPPLH